MAKHPKIPFNEIESQQAPDLDLYDLGLYDPAPVDEDELWFLPGPETDAIDAPHALPLPQADQRPLVDLAAWAAAEASCARALTDLAIKLGGLMTRLAAGPAGWRQRLALQEAADLSWLSGDRVPMARLALWMTLRLTGDTDDAQALARAGWAARRLQGGAAPQQGLARFLGRHSADTRLADQIADWEEVMGQAQALHPITQSALGYHLWPVLGLSGAAQAMGAAPALPMIEAAVVAARHATQGSDLFLPLALGGAGGLQGRGAPQARLQRWIAGADHATLASLRILDRLDAWEAQAQRQCTGLSGRTPPQLLKVLCAWPLVSAPMAEAMTGASRAAVQRNLNWMTHRGLIREITGQGRYRFWTAA